MAFGTLHRGRALVDTTLVQAPLLVAPWLAAGSVTLLFGPPSAGKTHMTISVADALLRGEPLWGVYPTQKSRVLVVQADMNTALYQERLRPNAALLTEDFAALTTDALPFDVLKLATDPTIAAARAFAPHVIFVDTLRKSHQLDESDSTTPDLVYGAWRRLFPGAAFVFLHHSRKVSLQATNADTVVREAFRGSGAWAASADTIIMLRRARRKNNPAWLTRVHFVRTRSCQEPAPLLLRLNANLMLETCSESTVDTTLLAWLATNPRATRVDAVKWLLEQKDEQGQSLCGQATAYRAWERVVKGEANG